MFIAVLCFQIPFSALPTSTHVSHHNSSTALHLKLHHPSILSLLSVFQTATAHFHVLELCSSGTLSSFLMNRPSRCLSENEARSVLRALIDGLAYLARERVVHRDLKADNILLTEDYRVVSVPCHLDYFQIIHQTSSSRNLQTLGWRRNSKPRGSKLQHSVGRRTTCRRKDGIISKCANLTRELIVQRSNCSPPIRICLRHLGAWLPHNHYSYGKTTIPGQPRYVSEVHHRSVPLVLREKL
jgi:serine/threonine protein kinase